MTTSTEQLSDDQSATLLTTHTETLVKAQYLYLVGWMDSIFASHAAREELPPKYFDLFLGRQDPDACFNSLFDGLDEVVYRHLPDITWESLKAWNNEEHTPFEAACVYYAAKWWEKYGADAPTHGEENGN